MITNCPNCQCPAKVHQNRYEARGLFTVYIEEAGCTKCPCPLSRSKVEDAILEMAMKK